MTDLELARQAANYIADHHKGAWAGVLLQVDWMTGVIAGAIKKAREDAYRQGEDSGYSRAQYRPGWGDMGG